MLDLGPDASLEVFHFVDERVDGVVCLVKFPALARAHLRLPAYARLGVKPLLGVLVTGIGKDGSFIAMQQTIAFGDVGNMASCAAHCMHQA